MNNYAPWIFFSIISVSAQTFWSFQTYWSPYLALMMCWQPNQRQATRWCWSREKLALLLFCSPKQIRSARMKREMGNVSIFCKSRRSIPGGPEPNHPLHIRAVAHLTTRWCCCRKFSAREDFPQTHRAILFSLQTSVILSEKHPTKHSSSQLRASRMKEILFDLRRD